MILASGWILHDNNGYRRLKHRMQTHGFLEENEYDASDNVDGLRVGTLGRGDGHRLLKYAQSHSQHRPICSGRCFVQKHKTNGQTYTASATKLYAPITADPT
jgi:hypothetical protein